MNALMAPDALVRAELLVGHLSDVLAEARRYTAQLRLRANAGHTTRSTLATFFDLQGGIWTQLLALRDEIQAVREIQP
jgi:hypothetical protein